MNKVAIQWLIFFGIVAAVIAGLFLLVNLNKPEIIEGSYPVESYEISSRDGRNFLSVIASDGVEASSLVDMSYFSPLTLDDTQEDAVNKLGFPTNTRTQGNSSIMEFEQNGYRLEVHLVDTGGGGDTEFLLYTYPTGKTIYDILPAVVTDKFDTDNEKSTITIELSNKQHIFVVTEGTRVDYMEWRAY